MKKVFSILNILIVVSIFIFAYLFYVKYSINKDNFSSEVSQEKVNKKEQIVDNNDKKEVSPLPKLSTLPTEKQKVEDMIKVETKSLGLSTINGYYENIVYGYSLTVPRDWPLKIRADNNISLGTVPPKDGQGAITIEIGEKVGEEIKNTQNEAKKYSTMVKLTEEPIVLSEEDGYRLTLSNLITGKEDYYIVINKNNLDYIIKYSNESESFLIKVETALKTFKFFK